MEIVSASASSTVPWWIARLSICSVNTTPQAWTRPQEAKSECLGTRIQRRTRRGWHEHYDGFRANCESVPRLPAWVVRFVLDDPRCVPYFLFWRWMDGGESKEVLGIRGLPPSGERIELKRRDGSSVTIHTLRRLLPRNSGVAVLLNCPCCSRPCRHLYGWSVSGERVVRSVWKCRNCAGLRYTSEGTYVRFRWLGGYPRTSPWDPFVFTNLANAEIALRSEY
jgi:hypothetical protein